MVGVPGDIQEDNTKNIQYTESERKLAESERAKRECEWVILCARSLVYNFL